MNESLTFQGCEKVNTVARGKSKNISLHLLPTVFSTVCENMRCKHMRKKKPHLHCMSQGRKTRVSCRCLDKPNKVHARG